MNKLFIKTNSENEIIQAKRVAFYNATEIETDISFYDIVGFKYIDGKIQHSLKSLKEEKLKDLESLYNESKKIVIQNGYTLVINHDTPERSEFIKNLPKIPNWNNLTFFENYTHTILDYWQQVDGEIYGFSADSIIWSEIFADLFVDKESKKSIFAKNKKFFDIYKTKILNATSLEELEKLNFNKFNPPVVIDVNLQAQNILEKFKPNLIIPSTKNSIKKTITKAIENLKEDDGEIHLVKKQEL